MLLCKHCSATAKTLVCYQHCFSCKSQTLMPYTVLCFSLTVSPQIWEPVEIKYLRYFHWCPDFITQYGLTESDYYSDLCNLVSQWLVIGQGPRGFNHSSSIREYEYLEFCGPMGLIWQRTLAASLRVQKRHCWVFSVWRTMTSTSLIACQAGHLWLMKEVAIMAVRIPQKARSVSCFLREKSIRRQVLFHLLSFQHSPVAAGLSLFPWPFFPMLSWRACCPSSGWGSGFGHFQASMVLGNGMNGLFAHGIFHEWC